MTSSSTASGWVGCPGCGTYGVPVREGPSIGPRAVVQSFGHDEQEEGKDSMCDCESKKGGGELSL